FGTDEREFKTFLSDFATETSSAILFRTHLNSNSSGSISYPNIIQMSSEDYPDTEEILIMSDILICDWSSIAFDYLLLDRVTIFLDVSPPFKNGFSLGPEYRYGEVVKSFEDLKGSLTEYLNRPANYWNRHVARHDQI